MISYSKTYSKRILQFSAYTLAIFTEYTVWVTIGRMSRSALKVCLSVISQSEYANEVFIYAHEVFNMHIYNNRAPGNTFRYTHIPSFVTVAHTELWIFAFFVTKYKIRTNMQMRHLTCSLVTTEQMNVTWVHCYPHTKFHHSSPYSPLDSRPFLVLANQNKYANVMFKMHIQWQQTPWVILMPNTIHILSFVTVAQIKLWIFAFFVISQSEQICKGGIKYVHWVMTDLVGNIYAYHYPHIKFRHCCPYKTPDICIFCY